MGLARHPIVDPPETSSDARNYFFTTVSKSDMGRSTHSAILNRAVQICLPLGQ